LHQVIRIERNQCGGGQSDRRLERIEAALQTFLRRNPTIAGVQLALHCLIDLNLGNPPGIRLTTRPAGRLDGAAVVVLIVLERIHLAEHGVVAIRDTDGERSPVPLEPPHLVNHVPFGLGQRLGHDMPSGASEQRNRHGRIETPIHRVRSRQHAQQTKRQRSADIHPVLQGPPHVRAAAAIERRVVRNRVAAEAGVRTGCESRPKGVAFQIQAQRGSKHILFVALVIGTIASRDLEGVDERDSHRPIGLDWDVRIQR